MKLRFTLPLLVLIFLVVIFWKGLGIETLSGWNNTQSVNQPFPAFNFESLRPLNEQITENIFKNRVSFIHLWSTTCAICQKEHDFIMSLERVGSLLSATPLQWLGISFKDTPEDVLLFLENQGNPFSVVLVDEEGRLGVNLGIKGLPETFLVDSDGIIRLRHEGALNDKVWEEKFVPVLKELGVI